MKYRVDLPLMTALFEIVFDKVVVNLGLQKEPHAGKLVRSIDKICRAV
jgi:hypothetical protein